MHAEGSNEVALEQPEGLGEQEGAGRFRGDAVDDLPPELVGHQPVEIGLAHRVLGAGRNAARAARRRPPQPLDVLLREHHRGVEADDRELPGDVEDRLDDGLPNLGLEVVELGGVVPGKARPVVAVVDVALVAGPAVHALEDHSGVRAVPVMVLEEDPDSLVR